MNRIINQRAAAPVYLQSPSCVGWVTGLPHDDQSVDRLRGSLDHLKAHLTEGGYEALSALTMSVAS